MSETQVYIVDHFVRRNFWVGKRHHEFKSSKDSYFGGRFVKQGSWCRFFETTNFGFLVWTEPNSVIQHIAKE